MQTPRNVFGYFSSVALQMKVAFFTTLTLSALLPSSRGTLFLVNSQRVDLIREFFLAFANIDSFSSLSSIVLSNGTDMLARQVTPDDFDGENIPDVCRSQCEGILAGLGVSVPPGQ